MRFKRRSLGARLALLNFWIFVAIGSLQYLVLALTVSSTFRGIEVLASAEHARRAIWSLQAEKRALLDLARDDATWNEVHDLARGRTEGSLEGLFPGSWADLMSLDYVIAVDRSGRIIGQALRRERGSGIAYIPPSRTPLVPVPGALGSGGRSSLVMTEQGPLILAMVPIIDSAGRFPSAGTLAFGRFFLRLPLTHIEAQTQISVGLVEKARPGSRRLPDGQGTYYYLHEEGRSRIHLDLPFEVANSDSPLWLGLDYLSNSGLVARSLLLQTLFGYALTVLLILALSYFQVRRLALKPLFRLVDHVDHAAQGAMTGPLALGSASGRYDEIGILADHVDRLIEAEHLRKEELFELNQELERRAATDPLTGLANRRSFAERLDREARRISRNRQGPEPDQMAFIVCDIDCFKLFNDRYGHSAGDACLRAVAETIRDSLHRATDLASRHGGEEFLVMLPGTGEEGALRVAANIREAVEALGLPHEDSKVIPVVTLSLGVAAAPVDRAFDKEELFRRADRALYAAKEGGRNRVVAAGDLPPEPARADQGGGGAS